MFFSLFYDNIYFFYLKLHKWPFFNVFQRFRTKYVLPSKSEFFNNFYFNFHVLIKNKSNTLYIFFSLNLHKLRKLNLFIGFTNIFKKIPFSCYIKCNTSHFNEKKIYISFRKRIFHSFFMFWLKMKAKAKNILTFIAIHFFFLTKKRKLSPF